MITERLSQRWNRAHRRALRGGGDGDGVCTTPHLRPAAQAPPDCRGAYLAWARRPRPSGRGMDGPSPADEQWWWYPLLSSSAPVQLHAVSAVPPSIVPAGTSSTVGEQVPSQSGVCEERPLHWMKPNERCGTTHQRHSRSPRLEPWGVVTQEMLAERAGLASRSVSDLERGLGQSPYADTSNKLADALRLSAEERAQFEGAARRRRDPSAPCAPDVPDGGPHLSQGTPAEGTSPPAPALGTGVRAGLLAPEQVAQEAPPSPQRRRDTLLTRLMTVLLVGTLLASTLISAGAARPHLPPPSGGTLCLATDLPTTGDVGPWDMSLEHAVQLAVQQNQNLGNGYRLEGVTY